jgi:hypothetical protein
MKIVALPEAVIPVKYALGTKVRISSVVGKMGKAFCELVII